MQYDIIVVKTGDGQKLFLSQALGFPVLFNQLTAYGEFEGGEILVKRGNEVITQTTSIHSEGTMDATTFFHGLSDEFKDARGNSGKLAELISDDFRTWDEIILDLPAIEHSKFFETYLSRYKQPTQEFSIV